MRELLEWRRQLLGGTLTTDRSNAGTQVENYQQGGLGKSVSPDNDNRNMLVRIVEYGVPEM